MTKNVRYILIGMAALAVIQIGGGYFAGVKTERALHMFAEKSAENAADNNGAKIEIRAYDRGIFSSNTTIAVILPPNFSTLSDEVATGLGLNREDGKAPELIIDQKITHGPLIFAGGLSIAAARMLGDAALDTDKIYHAIASGEAEKSAEDLARIKGLLGQIGKIAKISFRSDFTFSGQIEVKLDMPSGIIRLKPENGVPSKTLINIHPIHADINLKPKLNARSFNISWKGFFLENETLALSMTGIQANAEMVKGPYNIWYSDVSVLMDGFNMKRPNGLVSITPLNLRAGISTPDNGKTLAYSTRYDLGNITAITPKFKFEFDALKLNVNLTDLDLNSMAKIQSTQGQLQDRENAVIFLQAFPTLINHGLMLDNLHLALTHQGHNGAIDLQLTLPPNEMKLSRTFATNFTKLVTGTGTIKMDEEFVKNFGRSILALQKGLNVEGDDMSAIDAQLKKVAAQMVMVELTSLNEGIYTSNITLNQDVLSVNDKPVGSFSKVLGIPVPQE